MITQTLNPDEDPFERYKRFGERNQERENKIQESHGKCPKHPEEWIWPECPECVKEKAAEQKRLKEAYDRKYLHDNIETLMRESGVSRRNTGYTLRDMRPNQMNFISAYIKRNTKSETVVLVGNPGVGKTVMSSVIARELILAGEKVKFIKLSDLFCELKKEFDNKPEISIMDDCKNADWLILDDIGAERVTDWMIQEFYSLVAHRYDEMKPTVYTTNLTVEKIGKLYDPRIASRLQGEIIKMGGKDRRNDHATSD